MMEFDSTLFPTGCQLNLNVQWLSRCLLVMMTMRLVQYHLLVIVVVVVVVRGGRVLRYKGGKWSSSLAAAMTDHGMLWSGR
jgi:hypothetical protein